MTSDAKIGLLLGLVFIFMIAFIINGLPSFREGRNNNELTGTMVVSPSKTLGVGTAERKFINQRELIQKRLGVKIQSVSGRDKGIRFETALPKNSPSAKTVEVKPAVSVSAVGKGKGGSMLSGGGLEKVESVGKRHLRSGRRAKQSRWYVVREGDSLWRIAAQQLGAGSKYTEIAKLNVDILYDEDMLLPGMRLKMPTR